MVLMVMLGCWARNCGSAEVHAGYEGYDWDDGYDRCGSTLGLYGDEDQSGAAWLYATPMHDEYSATSDLYMNVYFELESMEPGGELVFVPEILGTWARSDAHIMDADTSHVAVADLNLEESVVEVLELVEEQDCSEPFSSRIWVLRWDLLWGERGVEPWYASGGEDEVYLFRGDC